MQKFTTLAIALCIAVFTMAERQVITINQETSVDAKQITTNIAAPAATQAADTVIFPYIYGDSFTLYVFDEGNGGYMTGHNSNEDSQFAQAFNLSAKGKLHGFCFMPAIVQNRTGAGSVTFKLYANAAGKPGAELHAVSFSMAQMKADSITYVPLSESIADLKDFFIGYDITYTDNDYTKTQDRFAMWQSEDLATSGNANTFFAKYNNVWYGMDDEANMYGTSTSVVIGVAMQMGPEPGPTAVITPSAGKMTVYSSENAITVAGVEVANAEIFDLNGRMIESVQNTQEINSANMKAGLYIIKVKDIDNNAYSAKVMIK